MDELKDLIALIAKRKLDSERRRKLLNLLAKISNGEVDSKEVPLDKLFSLWQSERDQYQNGPRPHYISPLDRSSYNSGYMEIDEMQAGNPNIW